MGKKNTTPKEQRIENALQATLKGNLTTGSPYKQIIKNGYLDDPNVREVHDTVFKVGLSKVGRPTCFGSVEQLEKELGEYFTLCSSHHVMPVVAGMCNYIGVDWTTMYAHANNPNSPFSPTIKYALGFVHELTQSSTVEGKLNPMLYMFLSGNYWGLRDVRQVDIKPLINNGETIDASQKAEILEQLAQVTAKEEEQRLLDATIVSESETKND